jgi:hypothetical protein
MRYPFWQMIDSSAQDLFDIGSQLGCDQISPDASFAVLNLWMTTVASEIKAGFCLPSKCNQRALKRLENKVHDYAQPYCALIFEMGIVDGNKQLDPARSPECFFEINYQFEQMSNLQFKNRKNLQSFLSFWTVYILFITAISLYDLYLYSSDKSMLK